MPTTTDKLAAEGARRRATIELARTYRDNYSNAGTVGHYTLILIADLADELDTANTRFADLVKKVVEKSQGGD